MNPTATQMSPEIAKELEKLKDIRLPAEISWWPLATGWWILLAVLLISVIGLFIFEIRRRRSLKFRALRELEPLRKQKAASLSAREVAAELCVLIRRIVLNQTGGSVTIFGHYRDDRFKHVEVELLRHQAQACLGGGRISIEVVAKDGDAASGLVDQ